MYQISHRAAVTDDKIYVYVNKGMQQAGIIVPPTQYINAIRENAAVFHLFIHSDGWSTVVHVPGTLPLRISDFCRVAVVPVPLQL